ncbi:MAG: YlxR family protein [Streptosporangiaceae bacterium]
MIGGGRSAPQRTCVGCRVRAARSDLLRVVAVESEGVGFALAPDPPKRLPGRGASLHPDLACLELALRRRAFTRALRLTQMPDASALRERLQDGAGL